MNPALDRKAPKNLDTLLIIAALAVLLASIAYWRTISTYRAPYRILLDQPVPAWIDQLYLWRWVVRGAMLAAAAALAAVEWRSAGVTRWLGGQLFHPWRAAGLVAILALIGRSYLLTPGTMALIDGLNNMASIVSVRYALEQGHWPPYFWSNYAWMGFPWLQFHNSLFYYEGALLDLALRDGYLSMKLTLLANHVLAAVAMFFYVRRLARSPLAGLAAATAWSTTFFHYHYFVHVGSVHLSLLIPFMPAALWCIEALLDGQRLRLAAAGLALAVSLALWVHPYYGAIAAGLTLLYGLVRLAVPGHPASLGQRLARLALLGGGIFLGCLSALSQMLPPVVERGLVVQWYRGLRFSQPDIGWRDILSFRTSFLTPDHYGGYVGWTVTILALLCLALAFLGRDRRLAGLAAWLAVMAYLSLGHRYLPFDEIFSRVPFGELVYAIRAPGKYLLFAEFALAALAGAAIRPMGWVLRRLGRVGLRLPGGVAVWRRRAALAMATVIAMEMVFLTLQVNSLYPEAWIATEPGHQEAYDWVRAHGDGVSRLMDRSNSHQEVSVLSGQPSFFSHIEEMPLASALYYWLSIDRLAENLAEGSLSPVTRDGLYLLDVGYLMIADAPPPDAGWLEGYRGSPFSVWQVPQHSPVVAAPRVVVVEPGTRINTLVEGLHLDRALATADHIPVTATPAGLVPAAAGPIDLRINRYEVQLTSVVLEYDLSQPAYLQLSYSAYPYLAAYLDGEPHDYFWTAFNLVGFASPAGHHTVELRPFLSTLRVAAYWLDAVGVLGIAALALTARRWLCAYSE